MIDRWVSSNRVPLNADKTQCIWLGTRQQLTKVQCHTVDLENVLLAVATKVARYLWQRVDLLWARHVSSSALLHHMRQLRTVRKSLTTESVKILVQALIGSRLEYYNSVFHRISADNLQAPKSVLNAGARLIMRKRHGKLNTSHYSDTSWRLTMDAYPSANNVQAVYNCLQVSTRGSSILSDINVCSGSCQHWPSLSSFSSTWRSDGAQNENDNVWITELCSLRATCMKWFATDFAFSIHHTWTVPKQTEDKIISLGLRDVTWRYRDCLGR